MKFKSLLGNGVIVLAALTALVMFRHEVIDTMMWLMKTVGPTAPALIGLASYVTVVLFRAYVEAPQLDSDAIMDRLDHANDLGEVAGIAGLLGTILAMAVASMNGKPELAGFLQSLTSTLIGSAINALVIFLSSLMRLHLAGCKS